MPIFVVDLKLKLPGLPHQFTELLADHPGQGPVHAIVVAVVVQVALVVTYLAIMQCLLPSLPGNKITELLVEHPDLGPVHAVVAVDEILVPNLPGYKIRHSIRISLQIDLKTDSATRPDWSSFS